MGEERCDLALGLKRRKEGGDTVDVPGEDANVHWVGRAQRARIGYMLLKW